MKRKVNLIRTYVVLMCMSLISACGPLKSAFTCKDELGQERLDKSGKPYCGGDPLSPY